VVKYWREVPGKKAGTTKKEALTKAKLIALIRGQLPNDKHTLGLSDDEVLNHPNVVSVLGLAGIKSETVTTEQKKARDLQAFDEEHLSHLRPINWDAVIKTNITKKLVSPFKALGWTEDLKQYDVALDETEEESDDE
jgi:hypothetical protein